MHTTGQNIKAGQAFSIKERQTPPIHCLDQYVVPETRVPNTIQARVANAVRLFYGNSNNRKEPRDIAPKRETKGLAYKARSHLTGRKQHCSTDYAAASS
jgi:hypothetical protein